VGGELEVHAVGDRIDRGHRDRPRAHDCGVVADPAHDALAVRPERALDRLDQLAFAQGDVQSPAWKGSLAPCSSGRAAPRRA
jgi:hypothetical protein